MKPLNILAIGNSFSHDAFVYLQKIFQSAGIAVKTVNLSIGGCSLETHWENAKADKRDYLYGLNGVETERLVSIREVLGEEKWDKIAFQQASHLSGLRESYFPHLAHLSGYIHEASPDAEQLVHQTWAYETDSEHPGFAVYENSQEKMYNALCKAYRHAASVLGARLIPAGEVIQRLRTTPEFDYSRGGRSLCRDGFHLNIPYGRYVAATVWFVVLTGSELAKADFHPDAPKGVSEAEHLELLGAIRRIVQNCFEAV